MMKTTFLFSLFIALVFGLGILIHSTIRRENLEYEKQKQELAMQCLHKHGGYPTLLPISDEMITLEYTTCWEITTEELQALAYLSEYYNIMLHTQ